MTRLLRAAPQVSVHLYKTISRETVDGQSAVSARYAGKDDFIDLTPFLSVGSSVRTSKSVREPAGGFSISFADRPQKAGGLSAGPIPFISSQDLESVYGLVEPMDMIEIRMWSGLGARPERLPVIMRGFVSAVNRRRSMSDSGPQNFVTITGQDYGKIWQIFQVLYLAAYAEGKSLLTTFSLSELFGLQVVNSMAAGDFVRTMVDKVLNPFLKGFMPTNTLLPTSMQTGESIAVKHGQVNMSLQGVQGSVFDILRGHTDVGVWNELYTEDRADGVHVVFRPIPALHISAQSGGRKIQDDATDPVYVEIPDSMVPSINVTRSDANVANFFWVNNSRFDLIDDMMRRQAAISSDSSKVSLKDYPNSATKYYGLRPMMAETQLGGDDVKSQTSGLDEKGQQKRGDQMEAWIDKRRRLMMEMHRDNVVLEQGVASVKGGPMRPDGVEPMKAGDYARFVTGTMQADAYVVQIDHDFMPFQSYTTNLTFERGEGFVNRARAEGGAASPWLAEQASRGGAR